MKVTAATEVTAVRARTVAMVEMVVSEEMHQG